MLRKLRARRLAEIAVMEVAPVDVRTRARAKATATAASSASPKRKKLNSGEIRNVSSYIQLRSRTIYTGIIAASGKRFTIPPSETTDRDHVSTSRCSSHGSSERIEFVDLKDESVDFDVQTSTSNGDTERIETTASSKFEAEEESDDMDSTMNQTSSEANFRRGSTVEKMPTDSEIEDFFSVAETKLVKQFEEKYNFDFVNEKPKEGHYEWIRLN